MSLKRQIYILCWLLLSTGCSAFDFEVEQASDEVVLEGDLQAFRAFVPVPIDIIPDQKIDVSMSDNPAGIFLQQARIQLTDTVIGAHSMMIPFSFINSLELWVYPKSESSTLAPKRLAWIDEASEGGNIPMVVDGGVNLFPYLKQGLVLRNVLNARVPAASLSFKTHFTLEVDVF